MLTGHSRVSGRPVGGSAVTQTTTTHSSPIGVDPQQLERRTAERYRDVANELAEDLHFPTGHRLAHVGLGVETRLR